MKPVVLTFQLLFFQLLIFGQGNNTWTPFFNKDSTLIGYKDKNGVVKIKPKFQAGFSVRRFDNIVAVAEDIDSNWTTYYLTKSGRIIGRDSLHMFDNGADCENEGFIRFRDPKTDKVGLFNSNGDIVIPALYNDIISVRNGMTIALKDAKKKAWEEHYSWVGGKEMLIDTSNNILIDSFSYKGNLNFFSLLISNKPNPDSIRQNFKTTSGTYFSFIDFDKEFTTWLKNTLLYDFTKKELLDVTYKKVTSWKEPIGWVSEEKNNFITRNYELIKAKLLQLKSADCNYTVFDESLNPYIYEPGEYKKFFNNCSEPIDWKYPVKDVVISYYDDKSPLHIIQDHIEFLRTDDGYKLISLSIKKGKIN